MEEMFRNKIIGQNYPLQLINEELANAENIFKIITIPQANKRAELATAMHQYYDRLAKDYLTIDLVEKLYS